MIYADSAKVAINLQHTYIPSAVYVYDSIKNSNIQLNIFPNLYLLYLKNNYVSD